MSFTELIGRVIHNCGAIELLTNEAIRKLATDSLLANEALELRFEKRIDILFRLVKERTKVPKVELDSLCRELKLIFRERNVVAHNPIVSEDEKGTNPYILRVRYEHGSSKLKKITPAELEQLATRTRSALERFTHLLPFDQPSKPDKSDG